MKKSEFIGVLSSFCGVLSSCRIVSDIMSGEHDAGKTEIIDSVGGILNELLKLAETIDSLG